MSHSAAAPAPADPAGSAGQPALVPLARLVLGADGTVTDCDDEAARQLGRVPASIVGEPLAALGNDSDRARLGAALAALRAGDPAALRLEVGLERGDATTVSVALSLATLPASTPRATFLATFLDVSDRHRAERATLATASVTRAMARAGSPERALGSLLAALGGGLGWEQGTFWSLAHDGSLDQRAHWSAGDEDVASTPARRAEDRTPLPTRPAATGRATGPADELDAEVARRTLARDALTWVEDLAAVAAPVRRDGATIGVMELRDALPRPYDAADAETLVAAAAQVGELLAILEERHNLLTSLARLALTDGLTGLPNRRAWQEALSRELARAASGEHPVCVAMLDLDGFKAYNDTHGHPAGDRVLAESARAWQRQLRASDLLARYGGEEFGAVIPAWPLQTAVEVVERLRRATPGPLTASAGVAGWDGEESGDALVARADAALYEAKQAGRDRTVAAPSPEA